jgi:hypothetical protein
MESHEENVRTGIADEDEVAPTKDRKRVWLYVGLVAALLAVVVAILSYKHFYPGGQGGKKVRS